MHLLVKAKEFAGKTGDNRGSLRYKHCPDFSDLRWRNRPDQVGKIGRLKGTANETALMYKCNPHWGHDRANLRKNVDQVLLGQESQCLAHRLAAHTHGQRDCRFGEGHARSQLAHQYGVP
jgi:hypothetical protein